MLFFRNIIILTALLTAIPELSMAGNITINGYGAASFNKSVESYKESLFDDVIRQRFDFSCGSAALATLLYHHYYYNVGEEPVLKAMYEVGDQETIRQKGFSLLDMKRYLASVGLDSDGYRMSLDKLSKAGIPSVALINMNGYLHFVVIKGIYEDNVLIGDPSLGMKIMKKDEFEKIWNGIAFVIKSEMEIAKATFNVADKWAIRERIDLGTSLSQESLASLATNITPTPNFYAF